jgi:tyrosinase
MLDPVFFLYHTQLDQLWWKWQVLHPEQSLDYTSVASHGSEEQASVKDVLLLGGLAPNITVLEVLNTVGGLLCLQY